MALQAGHIDPEEVDPELEAAHTEYVQKARLNHKRRMSATKGKLHHVLKTAIDIKGLSWYPGTSDLNCAAIGHELATQHGMHQAPGRLHAHIFICNNPVTASIKTRFAATLTGSAICNMEYIRGRGTTGICLSYKPATKTRRLVGMTDAFMTMQPVLA